MYILYWGAYRSNYKSNLGEEQVLRLVWPLPVSVFGHKGHLICGWSRFRIKLGAREQMYTRARARVCVCVCVLFYLLLFFGVAR